MSKDGPNRRIVRQRLTAAKKGVSLIALSAATLCGAAIAQDAEEVQEEEARQDVVVVTGVRQALKDSMAYKRNSQGVVDAINSEDIGKFPSSNLAESLQRIPGVSIDRVNGEGSLISVRGLGPNFNLVTLNGRTMPTADIRLVGQGVANPSGTGRAFDFSTLAPDGIQALEVFKTGRADAASGGIGATVNVVTRRPLDADGLEGAFGAKAVMDTSVDRGDEITPELTGMLNWSSDDKRFGLGGSVSYQSRDSAAPSATSAQWNSIPYSQFLANDGGNPAIVIDNAPSSANTLVTTPFDSRVHFSEFTSERTNAQLVAQFAPTDSLRVTGDYTYSSTESEEQRADLSNWFGRNFTNVIFDSSPVPTTVFVSEDATNKSQAYQQQTRSLKDELNSFGLNVEYDFSENLTIEFDAHTSRSEVSPNGAGGYAETNVGIELFATPDNVTLSHGVDYSGAVPIQQVIIPNTAANAALTNEELAVRAVDVTQAGTSIANDLRILNQENEVDQIDLNAKWRLDDNSEVVFGANYRVQSNGSTEERFQQVMGNWGGENRGDIEQIAPGSLEAFCLSCRFDAPIGGVTVAGSPVNNIVYGIRGDAEEIFAALTDVYGRPEGFDGIAGTADDGRTLNRNRNNVDNIEETVLAFYAQYDSDFEIAGHDASLSVGLRYEETEVESSTSSLPVTGLLWQGNNDYSNIVSASADGFSQDASYSNILPNVDFAVDLTQDVRARASYSKTLARPTYNNLFASGGVSTPNAPTFLGGAASASSGNPGLLPLESENVDFSLEWYYDDDSFLSAGVFEKRVQNFVGIANVSQNLFGITDPTSGLAGTRSGDALTVLNNLGAQINQNTFFAATALVDALGATAAEAQLATLLEPDGSITALNYDPIEAAYDVAPDPNDPLLFYSVAQPTNAQNATIRGLEIQGQHFFGDTGFGVLASLTLVDSDVSFDNTSATAVQFAVVGLSDTANLTLIYEKDRWSGRLSYNWRDEFLQNANDGSSTFDPIYFEAYSQLDFSADYDLSERVTLSFDAINLTEEDTRSFQRSETAMNFYRENAARYYLGARYKF